MGANSKLQDPFVDALFEALMLLNNKEEYYRFFEDLVTVTSHLTGKKINRRWQKCWTGMKHILKLRKSPGQARQRSAGSKGVYIMERTVTDWCLIDCRRRKPGSHPPGFKK